MGKEANFGENIRKTTFKDRPEHINKEGRPRKSWNNFKEAHPDIEPLTKKAYMDTIEMLFNMTEMELKEIASDKEQPLWLRYIINDMGRSKVREKMAADLRDYIIGKAPQSVKVDAGDDSGGVEVFVIGGQKVMFGSGKIEDTEKEINNQ